MTRLAIYGGGGLGREILMLIRQINQHHKQWNPIGFYDDMLPKKSEIEGIPVLGGINELNNIKQTIAIIIAIGHPKIKRDLIHQIDNPNIEYPNLVHPTATIGRDFKMKEGCVIANGTIITIGCKIGAHVLVNLCCTIGHDASVGDYSAIMPGTNISGMVRIGHSTLVGTGAQILQGVKIGNGSTVGAGAVVLKNVPSDATVVGVPAKQIH